MYFGKIISLLIFIHICFHPTHTLLNFLFRMPSLAELVKLGKFFFILSRCFFHVATGQLVVLLNSVFESSLSSDKLTGSLYVQLVSFLVRLLDVVEKLFKVVNLRNL